MFIDTNVGYDVWVSSQIKYMTNWRQTMQPLTAKDRESDEAEIFTMAKQALRNIALCYVDLDDDPNRDWESPKPDETEKFILIGFVGIEDPVRPEVPEAVRMCQKAGIKV